MNHFADVAVPLGVRKTFVYSVPPALGESVATGSRVLVPFGRKLLVGIVTGCHDERPEGGFRVRPIRAVIDARPIASSQLVDTALWASSYYFAPPGETMRALFPAGSATAGGRSVRLSRRASDLLAGGLRPPGLKPQEDRILDLLARSGEQTAKRISNERGLRDAAVWIESLAARGWVEVEEFAEPARVAAKIRLGIRVIAAADGVRLTPLQQRFYAALDPGGQVLSLQTVLDRCGCNASVPRSLEKKGLVEIAPMKIDRIPVELTGRPAKKTVVFTPQQQKAFDQLRGLIHAGRAVRCLLHGVTGSGKTEIYLRLISEVLARGETAMLLVPEIGLTPMLSRIASSHFPDRVALVHSGMSPGERFDQWHRIRSGAASVVVGTRSAVFAPLERLRLVVIDEEQDGSYKQDESPCYHAREVAWRRMGTAGGVLLMGSATPSLETYYAAKEKGEAVYLRLAERIEARPLPEVEIVDMSVEFQRHGKKTIVSETLRRELALRLERGEQSIVLLNRRGYSRFLLCRSCGHVFACPDCSVSMTYHQKENRLICHYCGTTRAIPTACAGCGGSYIYFVGAGTEQLEKLLRAEFPRARLARVDRDTTRRKGALGRILLDFAEGKLDLLVGTQMLAKGHDFPNVTFVGVIEADTGLSFPDFRAAERTFQLLTQVAGRAGRGELPGRVVIQSFYPDHYALRFARSQDYEGFYRHEIEFRRLLAYPPFSGLIQILVSDEEEEKSWEIARRVAQAVKSAGAERAARLRILGPASAPIEKLRGRYRHQVLLKIPPGHESDGVLERAFAELARRKVPLKSVHVDVDPLSLL